MGVRRWLAGFSGFALTALLALFHGRLLWQRLADGSLLQPVVIARWAVSAFLVVALFQLWSKGRPVLRGRRASVLWLVVVLVHAMAPGGALPAVEPVAEMVPAALAMLAFLAFVPAATPSLGSSVIIRLQYRRRQRPRRFSAGWCRVLFSRPPPVSLHP